MLVIQCALAAYKLYEGEGENNDFLLFFCNILKPVFHHYIIMLHYYACTTLLMLFAHVQDDRATAWYHQVNSIKGGSIFLFTMGNADFKLNTSVFLSVSGNPLFT